VLLVFFVRFVLLYFLLVGFLLLMGVAMMILLCFVIDELSLARDLIIITA
jgi:hypothetical protein